MSPEVFSICVGSWRYDDAPLWRHRWTEIDRCCVWGRSTDLWTDVSSEMDGDSAADNGHKLQVWHNDTWHAWSWVIIIIQKLCNLYGLSNKSNLGLSLLAVVGCGLRIRLPPTPCVCSSNLLHSAKLISLSWTSVRWPTSFRMPAFPRFCERKPTVIGVVQIVKALEIFVTLIAYRAVGLGL